MPAAAVHWLAAPLQHGIGTGQTLQRYIAGTIAAGKGLGVASDCALRIRRHGQAEPLQLMLYPIDRDALLRGGDVHRLSRQVAGA